MSRRNNELVAATLKLAHSAGIHRVFGTAAAGRGVILMLHKVGNGLRETLARPQHRDLVVTPEFLGRMIERVRRLGYDIVTLDEAVERLGDPGAKRFAVFTLDDGYRDTLEVAYPLFRAADAPFTVYIPTSWADGRGMIKWAVLEALAARGSPIEFPGDSLPPRLPTDTPRQRAVAIETLDGHLNRLDSDRRVPALLDIARANGIDVAAVCRREIMTWDEIRQLARDDLVTIGAHSVDHVDLSELAPGERERQIVDSKARVEAELGLPCRHFAYPYGDMEVAGSDEVGQVAAAGFATAVTSRRGVVSEFYRNHLTALPRIAMSGRMEDPRCLEMLISGVPDMVLDHLRRRVA